MSSRNVLFALILHLAFAILTQSEEWNFEVFFQIPETRLMNPTVFENNASSCADSDRLANAFKNLNFDHSDCPNDKWLLKLANSDPLSRKTLINIGVNKGYNVALWIDSFLPFMGLTTKHWYDALVKRFPQLVPGIKGVRCPLCGCCNDCKAKMDHTYESHSTLYELSRGAHLDVIIADLNCENLRMIKQILDDLSANSFPQLSQRTSIYSVCAGLTDKPGTITLPKCSPSSELCGLNMKKSEMAVNETMTVPLTTLDDIAINYLLHKIEVTTHQTISRKGIQQHQTLYQTLQNLLHKKRHPSVAQLIRKTMKQIQYLHHSSPQKIYQPFIDMMIIDTEGFDYLVVQGGKKLFESRSVRIFSFEYHKRPPWNKFKLEDLQKQLDNFGYECYFQGRTGLWPITGKLCWNPIYEFHWWSNVLCVCRDDVWFTTIQEFVVRTKNLSLTK